MANILLTEPTPGWMDPVRVELERMNHVLVTVRDGEAAQKFLLSGRADCAVLDEMVIKMYGLRLLARLATVYRDRTLRVAIMTSAPEEDAQVMETLQLSSDLLLVKPVDPAGVLWAIRRMLGESGAARAAAGGAGGAPLCAGPCGPTVSILARR